MVAARATGAPHTAGHAGDVPIAARGGDSGLRVVPGGVLQTLRATHAGAGLYRRHAGSGVGWVLVVLKHWQPQLWRPLDVQIAEANTFFSAMAFPHLLVAAA